MQMAPVMEMVREEVESVAMAAGVTVRQHLESGMMRYKELVRDYHVSESKEA